MKRSQVSDQTIGQILRYMGWVYLNLAKVNDKVYGVIVGNSFSEKLDHAFVGVQSEHIYDLIELFEHPFNDKNKPKNR
mgnify:FL=1